MKQTTNVNKNKEIRDEITGRITLTKVWISGLILTAVVGACGCGSDGGNMASGQYESSTEAINASGIECDAAADYQPGAQADAQLSSQADMHIDLQTDTQIDMQTDSSTEIAENVKETNITSIKITHGTTGEIMEISKDSQPEAFCEIIEKYEALDVKKSDNQEPWTGYSYWLRLYDEEGQELHSVFPKGHYVEIDNVRYEDYEKTTTVELLFAVDALWEENLLQAELLETELQEIAQFEGVSMEVTYLTSKGMCLQLTNNSDSEILFGDSYYLQVLKDGKWYEVGYIIENWGFNAIGYVMPPDSERGFAVRWDWLHGKLAPGIYRIVKDMQATDKLGVESEFQASVEFEVVSRVKCGIVE